MNTQNVCVTPRTSVVAPAWCLQDHILSHFSLHQTSGNTLTRHDPKCASQIKCLRFHSIRGRDGKAIIHTKPTKRSLLQIKGNDESTHTDNRLSRPELKFRTPRSHFSKLEKLVSLKVESATIPSMYNYL